MSKKYYEILGVDKNATESDIKKAYRKLAMQWHPDKHAGDKQAEAKFKEINEAYQVLSNPEKKKQYDTFGSADFSGGFPGGETGWGGFGGFDFGDIFGGGTRGGHQVEFDLGDIFSNLGGMGGGARSQQAPRQTPSASLDMTSEIDISLRDLLLGTKISVEWPDGKRFSFTIPENTKPGTKFKIKGKGKKSGTKTGNLYIKTNVVMPKKISKKMREGIEKW